MESIAQEDALIAEFAGVTSVPGPEARQYLAANNWDIHSALAEFYTAQEEEEEDDDDTTRTAESYGLSRQDEFAVGPVPTAPATSSGGRRLDDGLSNPQPIPTSSPSQPKKNPGPQKKIATLGDFSSDSHARGEDDDDDNRQDMFAGGEKSGLAVQNPDDLKKKILEKAMKTSKAERAEKARPSHFSGIARTLGGDDVPSEVIETPPAPQQPERVDRTLHFWNNGFSIDDGDLYPTENNPRNAAILEGIRQGRAPLSIMGVVPGQEIDVEIKQHDEVYVKPKKKYVPFGGQGNRLGSPTRGTMAMPGAFVSENAGPTATRPVEIPKPELDESQPTVAVQIRLGDGTKLPGRFNTTQTIGDLYSFVTAASVGSQDRNWVLTTGFPPKELSDQSQIIGETADLRKGGVVIQKWR